MRCLLTKTTPIKDSVWGKVRVGVTEVTQVADCLEEVLAFAGLASVVLNYKDGTRQEYTAWEYDCLGCGSYDHAEKDCPHLAEDDDDDEG